jgi:hypothetical protein
MLSDWRKYRYLWWGALILMGFFMVATAADATVCQIKTDQDGNCQLPCLCCHIAGAIHASSFINVDHATPYVQATVSQPPVILVSPFFHPPRP